MASQGNLTINDGQSTPVARTFYAAGAGWSDTLKGILANWNTRFQAAAVGYWKLSLSFKQPEGGNRKNYQVTAKSSVPVLENVTNSTVSGIAPAPTISYMPISTTTYSIPERSSQDARNDLYAVHSNFLASAPVASAVKDLEATT